ncbi:MAG: hypothetical protein HY720_09255 [Planctomycetes bacterium]|nr:hypothetical protein [Planctomycetota bacterium]
MRGAVVKTLAVLVRGRGTAPSPFRPPALALRSKARASGPLPFLALALLSLSCGSDEPGSPYPEPPPVRRLSEEDLVSWSAVSLALVSDRSETSLVARFHTFDELARHLAKNHDEIEAACAELGLAPSDYADISEAIRICRSIEEGTRREGLGARRPETTPTPTPVPESVGPEPPPADPLPAPSAPEPTAEETLPEAVQANLALYRTHRPEIERLIHMFRFTEGGAP